MPAPQKTVGIIEENRGKRVVKSLSHKGKPIFFELGKDGGGNLGDIVAGDFADKSAKVFNVSRVLGQKDTPGIYSLISLYEQGLSPIFSQAAMKEAQGLSVPELGDREDLRSIPLVTIDGKDSRDFDDAVFAEKTADGGYHLIVAIADVAHYVRPGSALDLEAQNRGNSTYFPDFVAPMLPEELSNGLCSLKPNEDRACVAFHLYVDANGQLTDSKVVRGLMRSTARLTYGQVQAAKDGQTDETTAKLMDTVINPLYDAYAVLRQAREKRGAIDMDAPETKAEVNDKGETVRIAVATRGDSNKVIEEFMVLANVAAAKSLESKGAPCVYRVHTAPPFPQKVEELRAFLAGFDITLPPGNDISSPFFFKDVIKQAQKLPEAALIIRAITRVQAKAEYNTLNDGHFGLALESYAHFTSPIRRYADLLVHRSLIEAFNLGAGGLDAKQTASIDELAGKANEGEKRSNYATRAAGDRFAADYLSRKINEEFSARITGVQPFGVFVTLDGAPGGGLLHVKDMADFYNFDETTETLKGRDSGLVLKTGMDISVKVKEADGLTGSVALKSANDNRPARKPAPRNASKGFTPK